MQFGPSIPGDPVRRCTMLNRFACLYTIFTIALIMLTTVAVAADISADIEKILREIRQDQPVPALDYLQRTKSINVDCTYYRGNYHDIEITVETHPKSNRVASVLLKIPGVDRTQQILPAVTRVIGPPRYSEPKKSHFGWEWANYRTASVHYAKGSKPNEGFTIISLFYR
jgi:hypothetical protein